MNQLSSRFAVWLVPPVEPPVQNGSNMETYQLKSQTQLQPGGWYPRCRRQGWGVRTPTPPPPIFFRWFSSLCARFSLASSTCAWFSWSVPVSCPALYWFLAKNRWFNWFSPVQLLARSFRWTGPPRLWFDFLPVGPPVGSGPNNYA